MLLVKAIAIFSNYLPSQLIDFTKISIADVVFDITSFVGLQCFR